MENRQRKIILLSFILVSVGFLWYFIFTFMMSERMYSLNTIIIYKIIPMLMIIFGFGFLLYYYLEVGFNRKKEKQDEGSPINNRIQKQFSLFKKEIEMKIDKVNNKEFYTQNVNEIINKAINEKTEKDILDQFEKKYSHNALKEINWERFEIFADNLEYNIEKYIAKLSRNGSINLIIGTLTTIISVAILGFLVFEKEVDFSKLPNVLGHYLPRISISIFIEIFSFFFLKLYRKNLSDVKYFENERTNIKSKILAFKTSYLLDNKKTMELALENLINTERNFVLKKDETSVELEKKRTSTKQEIKLIELIKSILEINK